jgi:hypothetical protein
MFFFTKYVYQILDRYRTHLELIDTIPIGFTGVAGQRVAPVYTNEQSEDALYFAASVDFSPSGALVRIRSVSPQYEWMADDAALPQDTPVAAIAGVSTAVMPILPLIQPFFVQRQGRLQMQFTNSVGAPITGGTWTWRALRLTEPINGGWNYNVGFTS